MKGWVVLNFNTIKWQDDIVNNLKNAVSNKTLSHAVLFTGNLQSGLMLANALADTLLCDENSDNACLKCSSCIKTIAGSHPDKIVVEPLKATIGVNEIRELIKTVHIRPFISDKKIIIFTQAHKMTEASQNALLKVLEAPPEYATFILVCEKEEQLLETILSRLTKYKLLLPDSMQIFNYLALKYPEKKDKAKFAAKFCEGNPELAEKYLLDDSQGDKRKRLLTYLGRLITGNKSSLFDFAGYLADNKDDFDTHIEYILVLLYDLSLIKTGLSESEIINTDLSDSLKNLADKIDEKDVMLLVDCFSKCLSDKKKNAAFLLSIFNSLLKTREEINERNYSSKI